MALSVIGAGFGRTGTMSLKLALEALGLGRCYHMTEVFPNPEAPGLWNRAAAGTLGDWDEIFGDYGATTDWPACTFYRELADRYPEAKVVLSVRDPGKWFDSTQATIFADSTSAMIQGSPVVSLMEKIVWKHFDGRIHDREHCIAVYERHNAEVKAAISPERLLVYDPAEGWAPLCAFLGLPVPDFPMPKANSREEFHTEHVPEAVKHLGL
jgi:hypothetical protein